MDDMETFTYSSQPHSAPIIKKQLSNFHEENVRDSGNVTLTMMSDPRVIRGNTHSLAKRVTKSKVDLMNSSTKYRSLQSKTQVSCPTYVYEVKSFANTEIDVSKFLIQQDDHPTCKRDINNQTDEFHTRPLTPDYIPKKTGIDRSTQVEDVTELFDFDFEVCPILEVIVRKTIEQSIFEIQSEYELLALETAAIEFHTVNDKENEWMRNKEIEVIKEVIKTKVQIQALELRSRNERATKAQIAGLQMMRQILPGLMDDVIRSNLVSGVWTEPQVVLVREELVPAAVQDTLKRIEAFSAAEILVEGDLFKLSDFPKFNGVMFHRVAGRCAGTILECSARR